MARSKERVIQDVTREINAISKEAFRTAMNTPYVVSNPEKSSVDLAREHVERMAVVFGKQMERIVEVVYTNMNDYSVGQGIDEVEP